MVTIAELMRARNHIAVWEQEHGRQATPDDIMVILYNQKVEEERAKREARKRRKQKQPKKKEYLTNQRVEPVRREKNLVLVEQRLTPSEEQLHEREIDKLVADIDAVGLIIGRIALVLGIALILVQVGFWRGWW